MTLTRWRADHLPTPDNLVLMMQNEAELLAKHGHSAFSPEVVARIESRLRWAQEVCRDSYSDEALKDHLVSGESDTRILYSPQICSHQSIPSLLYTSNLLAGCMGGLCLGYIVGKYM
jgi:hypothetical protein